MTNVKQILLDAEIVKSEILDKSKYGLQDRVGIYSGTNDSQENDPVKESTECTKEAG